MLCLGSQTTFSTLVTHFLDLLSLRKIDNSVISGIGSNFGEGGVCEYDIPAWVFTLYSTGYPRVLPIQCVVPAGGR